MEGDGEGWNKYIKQFATELFTAEGIIRNHGNDSVVSIFFVTCEVRNNRRSGRSRGFVFAELEFR